MEQLGQVWSGMNLRRRVILLAATLGMFASVLFLGQMAAKPRMALLYAGLDPAAAGEVVTALEARGAVVDVRGTAIYVEASDRDTLRLALAGEGLPQNGAQGYELLDALSGFGTTAQMFDAAYWRAKEGELARTITASRSIRAARVHVSNPSNDPFRQGQVGSASVTVTTTGAALTSAQAMAMRFLIASAVAGIAADDVSVIDSERGLLPGADAAGAPLAGGSDNRAEALRESVTRILEARVGVGKAIVEVAIDTVSEREEITERRIDPEGRVPISSDSEETTNRSVNANGGGVTVASNLPEGDAGGSSGSSETNELRSREVVNYEVSETTRAVVREPGTLRRLSVAVLVDGIETVTDEGTVQWAPRSVEELKDLRQLVASAVGFDETRDDQITIRSMEFQPPTVLGEAEPPPLFDQLGLDFMSLAQIGILALVSLILGLFVIRPIMLSRPGAPSSQLALPPMSGSEISRTELPALDGEVSGPEELANDFGLPPFEPLPDIGTDPAHRLRQLVQERQEETVEVLSQWMNDQEEVTG